MFGEGQCPCSLTTKECSLSTVLRSLVCREKGLNTISGPPYKLEVPVHAWMDYVVVTLLILKGPEGWRVSGLITDTTTIDERGSTYPSSTLLSGSVYPDYFVCPSHRS